MTTSGGDVGKEGSSDTLAPIDPAPRRPDWTVVLAWGGSILVILAVAGLLAVGLQTVEVQWRAIEKKLHTVVAEDIGRDVPLPVVEPLPGVPPADLPVLPLESAAAAGKVVTNPLWLVRSQADYPDRAIRQGIWGGRVELQCPVTVEGRIESCWILSETPAGAGFGQAALAGAAQARLQPATVDGVAVDTVVKFSTVFRLE